MRLLLIVTLLISTAAIADAPGSTSDCPLSKRALLCQLVSRDCEQVYANEALAQDEILRNPPTIHLLVEKTASTLTAELEMKKEDFRVLLQNKSAHVGDARFVTVVTPIGLRWQGQVMGYVEGAGKIKPSILFRCGFENSYDPEIYNVYSSSESIAAWKKSRLEFEKKLSEKSLNGSNSFILYQRPDTGVYIPAKVIGYQTIDDQLVPKVIFKDGSQSFLDQDCLKTAILSGNLEFEAAEANAVWNHSLHGVSVQKHVKSLPRKLTDLAEPAPVAEEPLKLGQSVTLRESDPAQAATRVYTGVLLGKESSFPNFKKLGERLWEKRRLKLFYSSEFNTAKKVNGMQMPSAFIAPPNQSTVKSSRAIALFSLAEKGELSDTGIHELGHMQTADNIKRNIADPLAIQYRPIEKDGKQIPLPTLPGSKNFYPNYSRADEVRQHAFNFWNATHQRVAHEIIENFRTHKKIKIHDLFGVSRTNFFESMDEALIRLQNIRTLNYRGEKLNSLTLQKLDSDRKLSYYSGYNSVFVDTAEGRVTIPLTPSVRKALMKHTKLEGNVRVLDTAKFPRTRARILEYVKSMLEDGNQMYRKQKEALETAETIVTDLKMNPDRQLQQDQFLQLQDQLGRVKTSVNLKALSSKHANSTLPTRSQLAP